MKVFKSPEKVTGGGFRIFLAGSIEQGKAEEWQTNLSEELEDYDGIITNPRRENWNPDLEQSYDNAFFKEQVNWELDNLDSADLIVMYFDGNTKSPISMLELGLYKDSNIVVYCPKEFWRKGNIDIVCNRFGIDLYEDKDIFLNVIKEYITEGK